MIKSLKTLSVAAVTVGMMSAGVAFADSQKTEPPAPVTVSYPSLLVTSGISSGGESKTSSDGHVYLFYVVLDGNGGACAANFTNYSAGGTELPSQIGYNNDIANQQSGYAAYKGTTHWTKQSMQLNLCNQYGGIKQIAIGAYTYVGNGSSGTYTKQNFITLSAGKDIPVNTYDDKILTLTAHGSFPNISSAEAGTLLD